MLPDMCRAIDSLFIRGAPPATKLLRVLRFASYDRLALARRQEDPIAGIKYSRATSIVSSAYKRHGRILETAKRLGNLKADDEFEFVGSWTGSSPGLAPFRIRSDI